MNSLFFLQCLVHGILAMSLLPKDKTQSHTQKPLYLVLSGPSQASTLVTSLLASLSNTTASDCTRKSCGGAMEYLNPLCTCTESVLVSTALASCMASQQVSMFNMWREDCREESLWPVVIEYAHEENVTFGKDNFSPLRAQRLQDAGFTLMVSWRPPWHTFPTGFYRIMHYAFCNGTNITDPELLVLRKHSLNSTCNVTTRMAPKRNPAAFRLHECGDITTHYVFFYKLITSAWRLNIPVVNISKLMRLTGIELTDYIRDNFPSSLTQTPGVLNKLVSIVLTTRHEKVHGRNKYNPPNGTSLSDHILQSKVRLYKKMHCDKYLESISQFCEQSLHGCREFNAYYFASYEC